LEIKRMKLVDIKLARYNPRKDLKPGDPEYEKIKRSIDEFDCVEPLVWNRRSKRLIGGHQRLKILKEKGIKEFEVSVVDLEEQKEKALNVALNKIEGEWDFTKLADLMTELDDGEFDLELTGFDLKEIEEIMNWTPKEEKPFDAAAEAEKIKEPKSRRGEIYQLGRHRLMCGDATNKEDVERLMGGEKGDLLLTDPPYNVGKDYKNENLSEPEMVNFFNGWMKMAVNSLKDKAAVYVFAANRTLPIILSCFYQNFYYSRTICWYKPDAMGVYSADYFFQWEPILYGGKNGSPHVEKRGKFSRDHWEVPVFEIKGKNTPETAVHPTRKPLDVIIEPINVNSIKDNIVIDLFGGSGTTLIACEQINRICYMMEIDPIYCDVIINRWEKHTGEKAELIKQ